MQAQENGENEKNYTAVIKQPRFLFIDNLRIFLIILVILVHLSITYGSPIGRWYYIEGQAVESQGFYYFLFFIICQAFYMGLFFFISAYFTAAAYERKPPKKFITDRLIRLGVPLILFALVIEPLMEYVIGLATWYNGSFLDFIRLFIDAQKGIPVGPLWFLEALLIFTVTYFAWKYWLKKEIKCYPFPSNRTIFLFGIILGVSTFAVRIVFPIGYSFELVNFQFCYFPQYIALFITGLIAFKGNWFLKIPNGQFWMRISLALLLLLPVVLLTGTYASAGDLTVFYGGLNWQSLIFSLWEQLFCVAVIISLIVWFRQWLNKQNRWTEQLSKNIYAVYVIQAPLLVFLSLALRTLQWPLLSKFMFVAPFAVCICFLSGYLIRRIPKVNRIL